MRVLKVDETWMNPHDVSAVLESMPRLVSLTYVNRTYAPWTDAVVGALPASLQRLRLGVIVHPNVYGKVQRASMVLSTLATRHLPNLEDLTLEGLVDVPPHLPSSLRRLVLDDVGAAVTPDALATLLASLPHLRSLALKRCEVWDRAGVEAVCTSQGVRLVPMTSF